MKYKDIESSKPVKLCASKKKPIHIFLLKVNMKLSKWFLEFDVFWFK